MPLRLKLLLCMTGADFLFAILLACVGSLLNAFLCLFLAWFCFNTVLYVEGKLKELENNEQ